ncbi:MAG TPA: TIGR02678 family protein [Ktedonobacteraceae bacterium]|nr:TIGR02678 family protein [Ktedonobacteraceae bacterium]
MIRDESIFSPEEQDLASEELDEPLETATPAPLLSLYHTSRELFQAHSALLDHMVVSVETHPDLYRLVRMHLATLQRWHEEHTGWRIQTKPTFFRLERHLHAPTPVALDEKLKRPRDFVCLTLLLWFAEKRYLAGGERNQQVLLSQLAEALQEQSQEIGESPLDFRNQQDRLSMWRALDFLIRAGGLHELEGEVKKWVEATEQENVEVLYEFTPITHSLIEALSEERVMETARLVRRHQEQLLPPDVHSSLSQELPASLRAWRTLLLGPILLRYDDPEAFATLFQQAQHFNETLAREFGWSLEVNDDYACVVRGSNPTGGPTLTTNGAIHQMLLLLCTRFRQQVEQQLWVLDSYGCLSVSHWEILPLFHELRQSYGSYWGASVREHSVEILLEEVYQQMRLFGLLRGPDAGKRLLILPTAARYSVSYQQEQSEPRAQAPARTRKTRKQPGGAVPLEFTWESPRQSENEEQ